MRSTGLAMICLLLLSICGERSRAEELKAEASNVTVIAGGEALKFIRISPSDHKIRYPNFYMLETEVTNKQFLAYLRGTGHKKNDVKVLQAIEERKRKQTKTREEGSAGWVNYRYDGIDVLDGRCSIPY
jgi:hypothetical protein